MSTRLLARQVVITDRLLLEIEGPVVRELVRAFVDAARRRAGEVVESEPAA